MHHQSLVASVPHVAGASGSPTVHHQQLMFETYKALVSKSILLCLFLSLSFYSFKAPSNNGRVQHRPFSVSSLLTRRCLHGLHVVQQLQMHSRYRLNFGTRDHLTTVEGRFTAEHHGEHGRLSQTANAKRAWLRNSQTYFYPSRVQRAQHRRYLLRCVLEGLQQTLCVTPPYEHRP